MCFFVHPGIHDDANPLAFPPWSALSVGSALRAAGADVVVADLNGRVIDEALVGLVKAHSPTVVGFTWAASATSAAPASGCPSPPPLCGYLIRLIADSILLPRVPGALVSAVPARSATLMSLLVLAAKTSYH
jgi:hypothetical protein